MEQKFIKYLHESFAELIERYGFIKSTELSEEGAYSIEFRSNIFVVKLEKYFRQFDVILYKTEFPDNGVNLFNLLDYLGREVQKPDYFKEEKDLNKFYKKLFQCLAAAIYDNFTVINEFFNSGDYESKIAEIRKFMINKYPNLFKGL